MQSKPQEIANSSSIKTQIGVNKRIEAKVNKALDIYKYLKEGSLAQAIESVAAVHTYKNQKTWVLYRFLDHGAEYYDELMKSPLQAELGDYRDFVGSRLLNVDAIKKLSAAGAPIFDADSMGKTLVYYAAMLRDVSLLRYLRDESFPFDEDPFGQDPLDKCSRTLSVIGNST